MADSTDVDQGAVLPPQALDNQRLARPAATLAARDGLAGPQSDLRPFERQTIVCIKWGTQYGPEYVNRLYDMVARQLWQPTRLHCLTDNPDGIRADVVCHPIPDLPLPSGRESWRKLAAFSPEVAGLLGEAVLFLDLDVVIVGALDALFDEPGDFLIIRDRSRSFMQAGSTSVFRFRPRRAIDVFEEYCRDHERITRKFRNEGEFLARYMADFGALDFWPEGWCPRFARDCIPRWPWRLWQEPTFPDGSRIVVFDRELTSSQALAGGTCERGEFRAAPWIDDYRREL